MSLTIIFKTLPYMAVRFIAYVAMTLIFASYIVVCGGILGLLAKIFPDQTAVALIAVAIFFGFGYSLLRFIKHYILYMIQVGHVAVVSEMVYKGKLPQGVSQFAFGKEMVRKNFASSNVLFTVDQLIKKSVKQIQGTLNTFEDWLSFIPGINAVTQILGWFVGLVLNYVDEAILGYIFQKQDQNVWKSSADGIVLYVQNWKIILKAAAAIILFLVASTAVLFLILLGIVGALIPKTGFPGFGSMTGVISLVLALVLASILKWAVLDPVIMVFMVTRYLNCALMQEPSYDLYGKLSGLSSKFKDIIENMKKETAGYKHQTPPAGPGAQAGSM